MNDDIADRIIDKKELGDLVPYSTTNIKRLENRGQFPKRIQLGEGRVGWSEREVLGWIEAKKSQRTVSE